jgi:hypothetical protein
MTYINKNKNGAQENLIHSAFKGSTFKSFNSEMRALYLTKVILFIVVLIFCVYSGTLDTLDKCCKYKQEELELTLKLLKLKKEVSNNTAYFARQSGNISSYIQTINDIISLLSKIEFYLHI